MTLVTQDTASGTASRTTFSIRRVWASSSSMRVPTSISPLTRTSPSSLGGRNSLPIRGARARLAPKTTALTSTVTQRSPSTVSSTRR